MDCFSGFAGNSCNSLTSFFFVETWLTTQGFNFNPNCTKSYRDLHKASCHHPSSGLLKWRPVGQIRPADHSCLALCQLQKTWKYSGQFQVTVFSRFCYVLLCNHKYIHCLNHRQAKDFITRCNETERKL